MPQTVEFVVSDVGHIGRVMLTRLWLFQAFITGILFLAFTLAAVMSVMENYPDHSIATFILSLSLAVLAGSILFYVLVQRKLGVARKTLNFRLEVGKSILATVLWILLLAFGALAPCSYYSCRDFRFYNVIAAWTSGIVLL
ncbi:hypothetical protein B0T26DRAFT_74723 [Lasiosphaeria miniovina]|uniref:Uncharacterized protein n=1 Tax=Lasiosphaeria miniovina TaxID=1954250 RepID=A0AA40BHV6_9PEZI|nr:uncharacterized protein B0T26DRAFT_74723 [Lasiosphaeria miniovina]KAK0734516.1 hypothetical protein B0T26DRAFT_74723 [Lasiosphaeria miniovina]